MGFLKRMPPCALLLLLFWLLDLNFELNLPERKQQ